MKSNATFRLVSLFFLQDCDVQGLEGFKTGLNEDSLLIYTPITPISKVLTWVKSSLELVFCSCHTSTVLVLRMAHRIWKNYADARHSWARQHFLWAILSEHFRDRSNRSTVRIDSFPHSKWKETKQQPSMLPGPPVPGCCLVSFHFLWGNLSTHTV